MGFGKRLVPPGTAPAIAGGDVALAREKVFPDGLWQGPADDMLRQSGMRPDDDSSLAPPADPVEPDRAQHEARLEEANRDAARKVEGGSVRPFYLIPEACWQGELGLFLTTRLGLSRFESWNVALLPADMRTAVALDAAPHPNGSVPAFDMAAERLVRESEAAFKAAFAEAEKTHDFEAFNETKEAIKDKLKALAISFLKELDRGWESRSG